jgi:hypothetical protein
MAKETDKGIAVLRDEDSLSSIKSLDDAFKVLAANGVVPTEIKELGTGFEILKEKDQLVGRAILVMGMMFNASDKFQQGGEFVSVYVVDDKGGKWIVNDASTGIYAQCKKYAAKGITSLIIHNGLTRSDYVTEVPNVKTGELEKINATTYYLSSV